MGARFPSPVQTGSVNHPAPYTVGTVSFIAVKRPWRGADHPPPSKCRGQEMVGLYLYSPSGPQWPVIGRTFTLTVTIVFSGAMLLLWRLLASLSARKPRVQELRFTSVSIPLPVHQTHPHLQLALTRTTNKLSL